MSKDKQTYDTRLLFMRGMLSFGRAIGAFFNPMAHAQGFEQIHRTKLEDQKRRKSHTKFKAQCAARREQRKLAALR
jgi:hypothetical protein